MLYEQGSRILNAVRYGRVWGTDRLVLPDDFVVSNVDLAATIFDLVEAAVPNEYTMDGISWLDEVQSAINGGTTTSEDPCCELRYIDVKQSRSIVTADYQYIWRATDDVETAGGVNDLYANTYDEQQLYDLNADPDQQINLIADYESYRGDDEDGDLSSTITEFQSLMRDYIDETCPLGPGDGECVKPSYTFTPSLDDTAGPSPVIVIEFDMTSTEIVGVILLLSVIGCGGCIIWKGRDRPRVNGVAMIKMENIESEDELGECKFIGNEEERQHLAQ